MVWTSGFQTPGLWRVRGDAKVQAEFGYSELKLGLGSEQLSPVSLRAVAGCKVQGSREPHFSYLLEIQDCGTLG